MRTSKLCALLYILIKIRKKHEKNKIGQSHWNRGSSMFFSQ